jgi:hypothetical protein
MELFPVLSTRSYYLHQRLLIVICCLLAVLCKTKFLEKQIKSLVKTIDIDTKMVISISMIKTDNVYRPAHNKTCRPQKNIKMLTQTWRMRLV